MRKNIFFTISLFVLMLLVLAGAFIASPRDVFAESADGCPVFTRNLSRGSRGSEVAALQQWLRDKGYEIPSLASGSKPGIFGLQTEKALKAYQRSVGITKGTGLFGSVTRGKIAAACAPSLKEEDLEERDETPAEPTISTSSEDRIPVSVKLRVSGLESVRAEKGSNLAFTWETENATYCYNSSEQPQWEMWKGRHTTGSVIVLAPSVPGQFIYSLTCGTSEDLHAEATSTVIVTVGP
jgi:hypothetical protein